MWPILLDMTKEESMQHLRCLEIDAFSGLVSALRAQGALDHEKLKIIKETGTLLHISQERHKAEIRRVVNDEKLNTIAYHVNGEKHSADEWADEGQRLIPLMPRVAPQTAYSAIADEVADTASKINKQLPSPACTERKRPPSISPTHSNPSTSEQCSKNIQFRMSEPELKKRKLENINMVQHIMGPPKISKIQQIYRQKTKARQKEQQLLKLKTQELDKNDFVNVQQLTKPHIITQSTKVQPKLMVNQISTVAPCQNSPKINILQNISIHTPSGIEEQKPSPIQDAELDLKDILAIPSCSNDNTSKIFSKVITNPLNKVNQLTIKTTAGASDMQKTIKLCAPRKTISKTVTTSSGQKLIVVSNPTTLTTSSILQRTLTNLPLKNISVKNLDKFKIMTPTSNSTLSAPIQIQNSKQKVVTVRTTSNKKMLPFTSVQVLNTKGEIKLFPLGGKIISKSNASVVGPSYFINSMTSGENTKSTSSTPILMCAQLQENLINSTTNNTSQESTNVPVVDSVNCNVVEETKLSLSDKVDDMIYAEIHSDSVVESVQGLENAQTIDNAVLEIVESENIAEAVCENAEMVQIIEPVECAQIDTEQVLNDDSIHLENLKIEVVQSDVNNLGKEESVFVQNDVAALEEICEKEQNAGSYYIIDGEHTTDDILIDRIEIQQPLEVLNVVGNLDPITGQYSVNDNEQESITVVESHILETEPPETEINSMN